MVWLNAALAFVVSMILFSTIVSATTESLHRIFHMREKGLRAMLGRLFDQIVWPRFADRLSELGADAVKSDFVGALTRNRAVDDAGPLRLLGYWFAPRNLTALPTVEFVQRLADTHIGKALVGSSVPVDTAVADLARQFERFGGDASAYFQQRAKAVSITIAVAVAFALNVDAVRLFSTLLVDPDLTVRLIERAPPPPAPAVSGDAPAREDDATQVDEEITTLVQDARREAAALAAFGMPIGPAYFPWCHGNGVGKECMGLREAERTHDTFLLARLYARWVLFTLVSGLLIGLGGPFWFDTFARLSSLVQVVKGVLPGSRPSVSSTDSDAATAPVVPLPATAGEAFRASLPAPVRAPRILLSSGGRPV